MFPKGDTPEKARDFYLYLQGHHETEGRVATWHVDWTSLAWLWGFVIVLVLVLLLWVKQYRTTRQRTGIYPVDRFGGWASEAAGPATVFFLLFMAFIVAFAVAIIVGHIVYGQKF
jgi:uncharacterized membrane protein YtjA (UPF0391 family)